MDPRVDQALKASLDQFAKAEQLSSGNLYAALTSVFNAEDPFMDKVSGLDSAFDEEPGFEPLREVFFDLLLINFFTEDVKKLEEDYLESKEWEEIEEDTLDRGTELLNLLLYLRECEDESIEPELDDYLKEFLLVDEDEFQDEHRIYEDVIANQILVDSSYEEIAKVANDLPEFAELKELFYPMLSFFHNQTPSDQEFEEFTKASPEPAFDSAVYAMLIRFKG
jgi:hypothetical protein